MEELMIKIDNVTKEYKLGQIGGTTLKDEIQRLNAKLHHREDPTKKIGAKNYNKGETFMALNGVSFEVKKGERVGIIGHNGAGKSTLLKLLSRVTAPTSGEIGLNGRVTSMLEVGTGFHGELTGRENIYMNGAILGMTKKEIDAKIEDIIEFSECRQFIDTPVKRYSSGMYVKLAFSVAAHLDSEIMIMDEVLAVGDMAFQKKCLDKMNDVSRNDGRTILYVSHNMNTIRQLCDRAVVLDRGKVIFDGDVERGIEAYSGISEVSKSRIDLTSNKESNFSTGNVSIHSIELEKKSDWRFPVGEKIQYKIRIKTNTKIDNLYYRTRLTTSEGASLSVYKSDILLYQTPKNETIEFVFETDTSWIAPGTYFLSPCFYGKNSYGAEQVYTHYDSAIMIEFIPTEGFNGNKPWQAQYAGHIVSKPIEVIKKGKEQ